MCCGKANFEQHKASKRHARKAAAVAAMVIGGGSGGPVADRERDRNSTTYVGLNSQCGPYVKQVCGESYPSQRSDTGQREPAAGAVALRVVTQMHTPVGVCAQTQGMLRLCPGATCGPHAQVISTELNKASNDLLTQLHAWEERAKQANPLQAAGKKRLASGLRFALARYARPFATCPGTGLQALAGLVSAGLG